jgi:hypothetical protein
MMGVMPESQEKIEDSKWSKIQRLVPALGCR